MKRTLTIAAVLVAYIAGAQTNDKLLFRATYKLTGTPNPEQPARTQTSIFNLDAGSTTSFFYDPLKREGDSLFFADLNKPLVPGATIDMSRYKRSNAGFQAEQNIGTGKIKVWDDLGQYFSYEEQGLFKNWKLQPDTVLLIHGMQCRKATTRFRGRSYTAWYAPEIAVATGPWKFSGLPGLILQAQDSLGQFKFECIGIKNMQDANMTVPHSIVQRDRKTTYPEFAKLRRRRVEDPQGFLAALTSGVNINVNNAGGQPATNMQGSKVVFNPIELTDD